MAGAADGLPPFSVSQVSTLGASFAEDVRAYAEAGVDGIGIWELKLAEVSDDEARTLLAESGLGLATAVPAIPSILPLARLEGPVDPQERIELICASVHRLAGLGAPTVICLTGPGGERDPDEARRVVVDGLRTIGVEGERAGVRIGLEPFQREGIEDWSIANTLDDAASLIGEAARPALGIQFDVWHQWNVPTLPDDIARHAHRIVGVHVDDWREPTRSWADRALPGEGVAGVPAILAALEDAGWDGFYDLEIFSDDGTFGDAYPDSLWALPPAELARRARTAFAEAWARRRAERKP